MGSYCQVAFNCLNKPNLESTSGLEIGPGFCKWAKLICRKLSFELELSIINTKLWAKNLRNIGMHCGYDLQNNDFF